jgi:predicted RNase H-like HicB family nuclease
MELSFSENIICRYSEEDKGYVATYKQFHGLGDTKEAAYKELSWCLAGVVDVLLDEVSQVKSKLEETGHA